MLISCSYHDPMVITIAITNSNVHQAFVDGCSSVNVMFRYVFEALKLLASSLTAFIPVP